MKKLIKRRRYATVEAYGCAQCQGLPEYCLARCGPDFNAMQAGIQFEADRVYDSKYSSGF